MISSFLVNDNNDQSHKQALTRLYWLRNIALVSQFIVIALAVWVLQIKIDATPLFVIVIWLGLVNSFVYWRLRQTWLVSRVEIAVNLTIDVLALAALLYFAGGSTNPLVSLFIIPVALSAVFLPIIYIVWMVVLTAFLYTLLMQWYVPLPSMGSRFGGDFNLHIIGMYGNFIFSAIIIAIFVYALASTSRRHEQELALAREKIIRNKHVVETGLMAANAAHEINTPLSTIGLLAEELLETTDPGKQGREDITLIQKQVSYCKKQLQALQQKASLSGTVYTDTDSRADLEQGIQDTVNDWSASNPGINVHLDMRLDRKIVFTELSSLMQTLVNLMDNAADASLKAGQAQIEVTVKSSGSTLVIDIDDFGEGLSDLQLSKLGKQPYTSKPDGMGIGLLLSHTSLDHLGGQILLNNRNKDEHTFSGTGAKKTRNSSGIRAKITLPLDLNLELKENTL